MFVRGKKSLVILLAVLFALSAILFTGCSKKEESIKSDATDKTEQKADSNKTSNDSKPVNISFSGWGGPEEQAVFTELINRFMEKKTNVKVEYINTPSDQFMTKLQTALAANQAPDSFYIPPDYVMRWACTGNILNLQPYLKNSDFFDENNVWPRLLDRYRFDGKQMGKGDLYALPKDVGPFALAYNKDLFEEAGVTPPAPGEAWTFNEFLENAKKLTKGSGEDKQYAVADFNIESAIWSHGGDFIDESGTKILVDTPEFIEGLQFYVDLSLKYGVAPTVSETQSLGSVQRWLNGKVAMIGMGPWNQAQFWTAPFEWDLMRWPVKNPGDPSVVWYGSMGFAVSPKTEYKQESFDLIAFLAFDRESQKANYEMGQAVPNLIDMAKSDFLNYDKYPKNKQEFIDIIEKYGRPAPAELTFENDWITEFWTTWDMARSGEMSVEEYCKYIQPKMQELLDKSIKNMQEATK